MSQLLISIFSFLIAISVLVAIHEFGHFWVARRFGIKVLRFSIGFGRPFFRWYDKLGTEYVLSMLPLGGYVSLYGERDKEIPKEEQQWAFSHKPVFVRMLVLFAGPFANLLFAVFTYWLMFMIGISSVAPIIGNVNKGSIADLASLRPTQEIVSVENKPTHSWEAVSVALISALGSEKSISVQTKEMKTKNHHHENMSDENTSAPNISSHTLDLSSLDKQSNEEDLLKEIGITPLDPYPPVIASVLENYPAANAGLKPKDLITAVNGHPVLTRGQVTELIKPHPGKIFHLEILRGQTKMNVNVQSVGKIDQDKNIGFIGIEFDRHVALPKEMQRLEKLGPFASLKQAVSRTTEYIILTFSMLKKMIMGVISVKHLSGPIAIAQYAGQSVTIGFEYFLNFLAVISISLGVLNLLPIPLLDGGHLLYCFYELITGRPLPEEVQIIGLWLGGLLLFSVMILALYNDLMRF